MFGASYRLPVKLFGIPVKIDGSFVLILPLLAWTIGSQVQELAMVFNQTGLSIDPARLQGSGMAVGLGLVSALGLFASVVLHELGHALTARLFGVEVEEITLWFLGGVAQFDAMPTQRGAEAVVGIAGPVTSVVLAFGLAGGAAVLPGSGSSALLFVIAYLASTNGLLAIFNLLPALPLDGGRVLRSLLAIPLGQLRATRIAASISRVVAIGLGIYGILSFNLFLALIAFFIYNAVGAEAQFALISKVFEGVTVAEIMTRDVVSVEPDDPIELLERLAAFRKHTGYPVIDADGRVVGLAKLQDLRGEDGRPEGAAVARDVAKAAETISADAPVEEALRSLAKSESGRLVVVDDAQRMVGLVSRSDVVRELQARAGQHDGEAQNS